MLRSLVRAPGFTVSVIITLGLAIGANTSVFTLVDQVVFRPLPVEAPSEADLLRLEPRRLESAIASTPALNRFRVFVDDVLRNRPHRLSVEAEQVATRVGLFGNGPNVAAATLRNTELPTPDVTMPDGSRRFAPFQDYFYVVGTVTSLALADKVRTDGGAAQKYVAFFESGSSRPVLSGLRDLGVDLTTARPIEEAVARHDRLVGEMAALAARLGMGTGASSVQAQTSPYASWDAIDRDRDRITPPERVMDLAGVKPGMVVGEVGAGRGYFTFRLASRVGPTGKVYANDIDEEGLGHLRNRAAERHLTNIATIVGRVDDPMLPKGQLDMVVMVNTFHDLAKPVELLAALVPCLKPGGKVVILDYDDDKAAKQIEYYGHFNTVTKTLDILAASAFKVDRVDTDFVREVLIVLSVKTAG